MKFYKIYGAVEFIFDGNSEIYVKVTKEDKDTIEGYKIGNWGGNLYGKEIPELYGEKIILLKKNLTGWQEVKMKFQEATDSYPKTKEEGKK